MEQPTGARWRTRFACVNAETGNTTIEGTVERVLSDRRVIELRTSSGALTTVYLPQRFS